MAEVVVPVTWKPQETAYYCGPAGAQMTLLALGANVPSDPSTGQDQLWNDVTANTGATRPGGAPSGVPDFPTQFCENCDADWRCWSTTPDALAAVLGLYQSRTNFVVSVFSDEDNVTDALLDNIDRGLPGVALIYGWEHWVVVYGYLTTTLGSACTAGGRALDGVYIRDSQDPSSALHLVHCQDWHDNYLEFIACGKYVNKIVAVVGSASKAKKPPSSTQKVKRTVRRAVTRGVERPMGPPAGLVAPTAAIAEAGRTAGLLLKLPRWQAALAQTTPQPPLLVRRLDKSGAYYIVPFMRNERLKARMAVDGVTGRFSEITGVETSNDDLPAFVPPPPMSELVWQPCHESMSPFVPFYLFTVGGHSAYRRVDGRQFDQPTTGPA